MDAIHIDASQSHWFKARSVAHLVGGKFIESAAVGQTGEKIVTRQKG
jgi:hypothetical protein